MKKTQDKIIKLGIKQLTAFKDFQDKECGGMTIRDFDVWLGGYISGVSHYYHLVEKCSEEVFENDLMEIAMSISKCSIAKELGVTGASKEEITTFKI